MQFPPQSQCFNVTGNVGRPVSQDNFDILTQKLAKNINTTESCWNTTESSVKATNGSGLYLHNGNETKYLCGITKNK